MPEDQTVLDLITKTRHKRQLQTQKAIWKTFGVDYEAEKRKQEEIYAALQKRKARKSKRKRKACTFDKSLWLTLADESLPVLGQELRAIDCPTAYK